MFEVIVIAAAFAAPQGVEKIEFFEKKIRPILANRCYGCHSSNAKKLKGGLLLDTHEGWANGGDSGEVIVPGDADGSLLIQAVRRVHDKIQMPPKKPLPDAEVEALVKWVKMGAPDPRMRQAMGRKSKKIDVAAGREFWAFQPPRPEPVPPVKDAAWPRTDVDRFVRARQEQAGLEPNADADRHTLIRRATIDLIGLPPTRKEVGAFVADDSPDAFAKVLDRLLASPQFGERWARHWLYIVRYAESTGRTRNFPYPVAWRYRDYVIDAFNADKPYDVFIREQLAGDLMPPSTDRDVQNARKIATGFLAIGTKDLNERNRQQYLMDQADDQIDVTGRAGMALTISCARCHDHKFDPIPTRDYYALAGIFRSSDLLDGYANRSRGNKNYAKGDRYHRLDLNKAQMPKPRVTAAPARPRKPRPKAAQRLKKIREELQQLAAERKRNRGKRAVQLRIRKRTNQLRREQKKLSGAGNRRRGGRQPLTGNEAMGVRDGAKPADMTVCIRGDIAQKGERVPRGFLSVIADAEHTHIAADTSGRLQLARWLTNADHPLTARVMVNRIWHHLFGCGLVRTVDNFGKAGERPSHPQLLDYLALHFITDGWSIKKTIRAIMLSRTYQVASKKDAEKFTTDPDNRLLWRMSPRRLEAEVIRDAMLAVGGHLDLVPPKGSPVMGAPAGEMGRRGPVGKGFAATKRSIYLPIVRNFVPGILGVFDFAEPSTVTGRRDVTTVATQALFMMNSAFVIEQARHASERLLAGNAQGAEERGDIAYRLALGRPATNSERQRVVSYVRNFMTSKPEKDAWASVFQAIFASAEFRYVR